MKILYLLTTLIPSISHSFTVPKNPPPIQTQLNAYTTPDLPYDYDALEPIIDQPTMKFHHDKHHVTYTTNLNKATNHNSDNINILDRISNCINSTAVRNNGGGHYNHSLFWKCMTTTQESKQMSPSLLLTTLINKSFGDITQMKNEFEALAAPGSVFGSGWVWLCVDSEKKLTLVKTANQDNPLMKNVCEHVSIPILGLDVWEHAYYLRYQNRRLDYVKEWWKVVNWDEVSRNLELVLESGKGVEV